MADAIEGTDIVAMHEAIVKKLSDQFKDDFMRAFPTKQFLSLKIFGLIIRC